MNSENNLCMGDFDAILDPLKEIDFICRKVVSGCLDPSILLKKIVERDEYSYEANNTNNKIAPETISNWDKILLEITERNEESSFSNLRDIALCVKQLTAAYVSGSSDQFVDNMNVCVELMQALAKDMIEIVSKGPFHEDEKRKLEETALILVDRIKYERHNSESKYSELMTEFHAQTESIERLNKQLQEVEKLNKQLQYKNEYMQHELTSSSSYTSDFEHSKNSNNWDTDMTVMKENLVRLEKDLALSRSDYETLRQDKHRCEEDLRIMTQRCHAAESSTVYAPITPSDSSKEGLDYNWKAETLELRDKCLSLEGICVQWQTYVTSREELLAQATTQLESSQKELASMSTTVAALEAEREDLQEDLNGARALISSLYSRPTAEDVAGLYSSLSTLKQQKNELEEELRRLGVNNDPCTLPEADDYAAQLVLAQLTVNDAEEKVQGLTKEVMQLKDEICSAQTLIGSLTVQLETERSKNSSQKRKEQDQIQYELGYDDDDEIKRQEEGGALEKELEELKQDRQSLRSELEQSKTLIYGIIFEKDSLQQGLEDVSKVNGELEEALALAQQNYEAVEEQTRQLQSTVATLEREGLLLKEQLDAASAQSTAEDSELVLFLRQCVDDLQQDKARVEAELVETREALDAEKVNNEAIEEQSRRIQSQASLDALMVTNLQTAMQDLQWEKVRMEEDHQATQRSIESVAEQSRELILSLQHQVQDLLGDKSKLEVQLHYVQSGESDMVSMLHSTVLNLQQEKATLEQNLKSVTQSAAHKHDNESELGKMRAMVDEMQREKELLGDELRHANTTMNTMRSEAQAHQSQEADVILELQTRVQELENENQEMAVSCSELERMEALVDELRIQNESAEEELRGTQVTIKSLTEQLESINLEDEHHVEALQASLEKSEKETRQLRKLLDDTETRERRLQASLKEAQDGINAQSRQAEGLAGKEAIPNLQEKHDELLAAYSAADELVRRLQDENTQYMGDLTALTNELESRDASFLDIQAALEMAEEKAVEWQRLYFLRCGEDPSELLADAKSSEALDVSEGSYDRTGQQDLNAVANMSMEKSELRLYLEIGGFEIRVGVWNPQTLCVDTCYICPSIIASCSQGMMADELILSSKLYSEKSLSLYRAEHIFVGREAFYSAYNHSDERIRDVLDTAYPLVQGSIQDPHGFQFLIRHALECAAEALGLGDLREVLIFISYKPTLQDSDLRVLSSAVFGETHCDRVCFMSECGLAVEASGISSAVVLDIGASSSYAAAVYQGTIMQNSVKKTGVGGEHVTEFLCTLLESQPQEDLGAYIYQTPRRRIQIARQLKEDYGFVATEFDESASLYGRCELDHARRLLSTTNAADVNPEHSKSDDIRCGEEFALPDGSSVSVALDCERFYCAEVLFSPKVVETCRDSVGLTRTVLEAVRAVDESIRAEVCGVLLLTGRSALLPGMASRLELDLTGPMRRLGVPSIKVHVVEGVDWPPSAAWSGITTHLRSQENQPESTGNRRGGNSESFLRQYIITAQEYFETGPSALCRSRLL